MSNFKELINGNTPVLVDFYATWCGPCKMMEPILDQLAQEVSGKAKILKVDVDKNPKAAAKYGVRGVPTLLLFKNGKIVWQQSGVAQPQMIKNEIDKIAS